MRIAILASEAAPFVKSGGLGDVMEALPAALSRIEGNEVLLLLPYYHKIRNNPSFPVEPVARFRVALGWRQQYAGVMKLIGKADGPQVYFIDNLYYFGDREGSLYGHRDDSERFAYFSKACLDALVALNFRPHILQCNDWQTGLIPTYLAAQYYPLLPDTKCIFTIHNVEYQGWAAPEFFHDVLALPREYQQILELNGSINVMKGAIETAHLVTTVSETYSRQLLSSHYAHGLEDVLSRAAWKLTGITNGIDVNTFDPSTDPAIPIPYDIQTFPEGKAICKAAVQREVGLPERPDVPLLVMVTRLAGHKGLDLLLGIAHRLLREQDCQLLVLGSGEPRFEEFLRQLAREFPQQAAARIAFDLGLAARIYAGGDIYLMPSRSEPCGLSQMNAMRYGAVPVVHATGGLKDTVPPVDDLGKGGLGFTFQSYGEEAFYTAIHRCIHLYQAHPKNFRSLQRRCMAQDFSWDAPGAKYMALFRSLRKEL